MTHIVLELDAETAERIAELAAAEGKTPVRWLEAVVRAHIDRAWPADFVKLAGAWPDFPTAYEIRSTLGRDLARVEF